MGKLVAVLLVLLAVMTVGCGASKSLITSNQVRLALDNSTFNRSPAVVVMGR